MGIFLSRNFRKIFHVCPACIQKNRSGTIGWTNPVWNISAWSMEWTFISRSWFGVSEVQGYGRNGWIPQAGGLPYPGSFRNRNPSMGSPRHHLTPLPMSVTGFARPDVHTIKHAPCRAHQKNADPTGSAVHFMMLIPFPGNAPPQSRHSGGRGRGGVHFGRQWG